MAPCSQFSLTIWWNQTRYLNMWVLVLDLRVLRLVISLLILPSPHLLGDQMKSFLNLLSALKFCRIKTLAWQPFRLKEFQLKMLSMLSELQKLSFYRWILKYLEPNRLNAVRNHNHSSIDYMWAICNLVDIIHSFTFKGKDVHYRKIEKPRRVESKTKP